MPLPLLASGDGHTSPVPTLEPARVLTHLGTGPTVLVVGYPAPAAAEVVERLLATEHRTIACVVTREAWPQAALLHRDAQATGRLRLFEGSAAQPGLGLPCTAWRLLDTADEIYGVASDEHLATRHLHDFADECPRLQHLHLVDTAELPTPRRRGSSGLMAPIRRLSTMLTAAMAVVSVGVVAPFALALAPWKDLLDLDLAASLSWEDLERDLWPGTGQAA